jgi:uncharacterized short protein YbdD (DUF466 family)|tara:strand:- start:7183 stop:7386 length:204 start_codon:yes stop_codon:yes gene_type:complete
VTAANLLSVLSTLWRGLRRATGDDAYDRYLEHWRVEHTVGSDEEPMDIKTFYRTHQEAQWQDVRRCC